MTNLHEYIVLSGHDDRFFPEAQKLVKLLPHKKSLNSQLEVQLVRLSSIHTGIMRPAEQLEIALEVKSSTPHEIADKYRILPLNVKKAIRDTAASYIFLNEDLRNGPLNPELSERIDFLNEIELHLQKLQQARNHPAMKKALLHVPYAQDLIDCFLKYNTVRYHLDDIEVPYTIYQLRAIRKYLEAQTIEDSIDGFPALVKRYTIGRWLSDGGNGDAKISKAAAFILRTDLSSLPSIIDKQRIRAMKLFLTEIMDAEYQQFMPDKSYDVPIKEFFPINRAGELDVAGAYKLFEQNHFCPLELKKYAKNVAKNVDINERVTSIKPGQMYSREWLINIDWAGTKFLENAITFPHPNNLDTYLLDTRTILREAKVQVLKDQSEQQQVKRF